MPVTSTDLVAYGAANHAEDDTSTQGGAIDETVLVAFTPLAANDAIEALSDNAGDTTQTLTITGRDAGGEIVSEGLTLNGTTPIDFTTMGTIERVLKIVLSASATGTVTVRRNAAAGDIVDIPSGVTSVRRLFYDSASESSQTVRYELFYYKNEHGTLSLTNAKIDLTDDAAGSIEVGCATAKGNQSTLTNRETAPGGVSFITLAGGTQAVPTNVLAAGETIGVYAKMTRGASAAPIKDTFSVELSGTST